MTPVRGSQLDRRRDDAVTRVKAVSETLSGMGVTALVFGSLATGRFGRASDVDLLIVECPRRLKYAIEGVVEDGLGGLPFDVVYLDEVPAWKADLFTREAVRAGDLG